jgi:hypothetical protein
MARLLGLAQKLVWLNVWGCDSGAGRLISRGATQLTGRPRMATQLTMRYTPEMDLRHEVAPME